MPARLRLPCRPGTEARVILADHASHIGSTMGDAAIPVIREALEALGIERRTGGSHRGGRSGGRDAPTRVRCAAGTIVWTAACRRAG